MDAAVRVLVIKRTANLVILAVLCVSTCLHASVTLRRLAAVWQSTMRSTPFHSNAHIGASFSFLPFASQDGASVYGLNYMKAHMDAAVCMHLKAKTDSKDRFAVCFNPLLCKCLPGSTLPEDPSGKVQGMLTFQCQSSSNEHKKFYFVSDLFEMVA